MISKLCAKAEVDKFQYGIYEDIFRKNGWIPGFIILRPVSGLSVCPVVCPAVPHNNSVSRSPVRGSPPCPPLTEDRKSTRLNSSHVAISDAVFCVQKKKPE